DPDSSISSHWSPDFHARRTPVLRHDLSLGESKEGSNEIPHSIWGHVYAVFRDSTERLIGRCGRMPVELHMDTAWPFNDCVSSNRIIERGYDNVRAGCVGRAYGQIHVRHQIARPFDTKWKRNGCLKPEHRESSDRR